MTLCIVPCGKRKIWDKDPHAGPTQARDAYIGPFARKCKEYAERFYPGHWRILSAKYGFLSPTDAIGNYDVSFKKKSTNPISIDDLIVQARAKGLYKYDLIVSLGGRVYTDRVGRTFPGVDFKTPLGGLKGIGFMMRAMKEAIDAGMPL